MGVCEFNDLASKIISLFNQNQIFLYEATSATSDTSEDFLAFLIQSDVDADIDEYIETFNEKNPDNTYPECIFNGTKYFHTFFPNNLRKRILNFNEWDLSDLYIPAIFSDLDKLRTEREKKSVLNNSIAQKEINDRIDRVLNNFLTPFHKQIESIVSSYYSDCIMSEDCITLLKRLFSTCINLLDDIPFNDSYKHFFHKTATYIKYTQSDFSSLNYTMENNFRIIITGAKGSGKTTFIGDYINCALFTDICYLHYSDSIESTLSQIRFSDPIYATLSYKEIYARLKKKNGSSILIIDDMNLSSNLLSKELEKIDSLNLRIIIITCNVLYKTPKYTSFAVPTFTEDQLIDYYQKISKISDLSQELKTRILIWTSKNPLLISLLAYASRKDSDGVKQMLSTADYTFNLPNVSFKHPYDHQTQSLLGHIKKLYDVSILKHENKILQDNLIILSCFYNYPLPVSFLRKIIPNLHIIDLEQLSELGFLILNHELNIVQLSAPIADAVFTIVRPSAFDQNLEDVLHNITIYIEEYDILLQDLPISGILFPLIKRLQKTITTSNNPHQKKVSHKQEQWWSFVYTCIEYYQSLGNYHSASALIQLLEYPNKETILYSQSQTDPSLFLLVNTWGENDCSFIHKTDDLIKTIEKDKLMLAESAARPELYMPNMVLCNYLASIALDKIILRIVTQQHILDPRNINYEKYFQNLLNIILTTEAPYPQIKKTYYKNSYTLLSAHIETMSCCFIYDFFFSIQCKNKVIKLQMLTVLACQCFNIIHYSSRTFFCKKITNFTRNILFRELTSTLNSCTFLPKYVFQLCFFTFLRYKQLRLGENKNILDLDTVCNYLIKKCPVLSSEEIADYLSFKQ